MSEPKYPALNTTLFDDFFFFLLKKKVFEMKSKSINKFCVVLIFLTFVEWSVETPEENILVKKFGYAPSITRTLIPPEISSIFNKSNEPVKVDVNMYIRDIERIDEKDMEMKVQVTFHMSWFDPRISYQDVANEMAIPNFGMIKLTDTSKIWIPDVFFSNERQAHEHNLIRSNSFVRIHPNGSVLSSQRISLTLSCPMNLRLYPHDSQICSIRIATYGSINQQVLLRWKSENPIQITKHPHITKFTLKDYKTVESFSNTTTGKYSVLQVNLSFDREFFYYFKKFYAPVVITILISWIPLWLERVLILRIYIAMSTVIFLAWHYSVHDADFLVSYNTALNTWNAANFIFVFLAALESLGIVFMIKTNANAIKRTHPDDNDEFKMLPYPYGADKRTVLEVLDEKTNIDVEIMKIKTNFKICFLNVHKEVQIIDAAAKLFFPSAYILFIFFYWITYC